MQWRKLVSAAEAACVEDKESGAGGGKGTVHGAPGEQWSVSGREGGATRQWCRLPSRRITHILRFGNGLDLSGLYSKWTKSKMGFDPALSDEL